MTVTREEAASRLDEIDTARRRSLTLFNYGMASRVFAPVTGVQVQTFITLLVAATYAIVGCWLGLRYAVVGAALAALAAGAFHLAPAQLPLIVSLLGGGALVLGGVWMRRAR